MVSITNAEIARLFDRMAGLLEIEAGSGFKARAYRRGAQTILEMPDSLEAMVKNGANLERVPGIGKAIAGKVKELLETGHVRAYERLKEPHSPLALALLDVPGVGGVTALRLLMETDAATMTDVVDGLKSGAVGGWLPKTGARSAEAIAAHLQELHSIELVAAQR